MFVITISHSIIYRLSTCFMYTPANVIILRLIFNKITIDFYVYFSPHLYVVCYKFTTL